jgi:hypothetical protein
MANKTTNPDLPLKEGILSNPIAAQALPSTTPVVSPGLKGLSEVKEKIGGVKIPTQIGDKVVDVKIDTPKIRTGASGTWDAPEKKAQAPAAATTTAKAEEKKPEEKKSDFNWLAALADVTGSGLQGYAGRGITEGYVDQYSAQKQRDAELAAQRQAAIDKLKGYGVGGTAAPTSPIGGYAPIPGVTPNQATITKAADLAGAKDQFNVAMQKFEDAIKAHGKGTLLPSAENQMLDSARADVISSIKGLKQLGTLDAGVERLVDKYLPATGGMNTLIGSNKEQMQKIIGDMRNQQNSALSATMNRYGFQETGTPFGASAQRPQTVAYMVEGKRYDIPIEKEAAFKAAKPNAQKVQ